MISLKRLEAMRRWQREGGVTAYSAEWACVGWAERAGLLRLASGVQFIFSPSEALAPAIAKAEAEHARHRTEAMRDVHRRRAFDARMSKLDSAPESDESVTTQREEA